MLRPYRNALLIVGTLFAHNKQDMHENINATQTPDLNVIWHFAIPVYNRTIAGYPERQEELVKLILAHRQQNPKGMKRSNQLGWHSDTKMHLWPDPIIQWLIGEMSSFGEHCVSDFNHPKQGHEIDFVSCWANVNGRGAWNTPHNHMPAQWSGVFYADVDKSLATEEDNDSAGKIDFLNPLPFGDSYGRASRVTYTPKDGLMLLFPSFVEHMVRPSMSEDLRISIAFNFNVTPKKQVLKL